MPRSSQQNQRIKDERREQIMQAGLTVFAHNGLAAAKISDVAAAADLSYGLVYHYFRDKIESDQWGQFARFNDPDGNGLVFRQRSPAA
jgi:AcrR family transcriptional regulator